jgi:hypothetical protein
METIRLEQIIEKARDFFEAFRAPFIKAKH